MDTQVALRKQSDDHWEISALGYQQHSTVWQTYQRIHGVEIGIWKQRLWQEMLSYLIDGTIVQSVFLS